jgi:hypothetical protein
MKLYAGIDLHSNNNYIGVIDEQDTRLFRKKLPNKIEVILMSLEPFKQGLEGVVVESTYNWYWLVDELQENGYRVHLANPSAIKQYEGLKHTDDHWDSFWLAHMLRLGILPEGYIYPKEYRPMRDLLRRRILFVGQRTSQILSFQSMVARHLATDISVNEIKKLTEQDAEKMFESYYSSLRAQQKITCTFRTPMHHARLRCKSSKYLDMSSLLRLAGRAPRCPKSPIYFLLNPKPLL